jgi:hypothetical protein
LCKKTLQLALSAPPFAISSHFPLQDKTPPIKSPLKNPQMVSGKDPNPSLLDLARENPSQIHPSRNCSAMRNSMPSHSPSQTSAKQQNLATLTR